MSLTDRLTPPSSAPTQTKALYSSARKLGGGAHDNSAAVPDVALETVIARLRDACITELAVGGDETMAVALDYAVIVNTVARLVNREKDLPIDRATLIQRVVDDLTGTGPIQALLEDPTVTEIMVNRFDRVFVERGGRISQTTVAFDNDDHLRSVIQRIAGRVGRRIDESSPVVDARLLDGSRVNAVIPPIALDGCSLTIRKFSVDRLELTDLIQYGTLSQSAADYLAACVAGKANMLISGGTGSGKTTTLNVLASQIPDDQRIVTIEDSAELQISKPNVVRLESRPANIEGRGDVSIRDLVKNALRMRPDRIIVGEVRDGTTFDMLQAMNTGHDGSLTTVHANSPEDALLRIESMVLMAGMDLPVAVIRQQSASALDVIIQQARLIDGRRTILAIHEVVEAGEGNTVTLRPIFEFDQSDADATRHGLVRTTEKSGLHSKLALAGVNLPANLEL